LYKPKVFWGEEEIEIVDKYVYLGVPFYANMKYAATGNDFINKGLRAQRELFSLFFKAKLQNIDVRLQLFDSLVKSVLLYCSHIWGVTYVKQITVFQMQFLRRMFHLPKYTQHWFLMLESNSKPIVLSFVKNLLFFITKIFSRPKTSLIRKCYECLKLSKDKTTMKLNWFRDVHSILNTYNCLDFIENEDDVFCITTTRSSITVKIKAAETLFLQDIIHKMQNSTKMPFYKKLKTHVKVDPIMNSNCNWNLIRTLVQLKSNIPRICVRNNSVNLNAINNYFGQNSTAQNEKCSLCSYNYNEDLFHFMYVCPAYDRTELARDLQIPKTEEESILLCNDMNTVSLRCISKYMETAIEVREEWLRTYS
jgi:hypothetical protein